MAAASSVEEVVQPRHPRLLSLLPLAALLAACATPVSGASRADFGDAATADAGHPAAERPDAGLADAGLADAGLADAGPADAGPASPSDSGARPEDASTGACMFNGETISNGASVTAFRAPSVPNGATCVEQLRTCRDGVLSGSYPCATCSVASAAPCMAPWGETLPDGASVTAYLGSSVGAGQTCVSETRMCVDGTLSGSYAYASCASPADTTLAEPAMNAPECSTDGASVTLSWTPVSGAAVYPVRVDEPGRDCGGNASGPGNLGCTMGVEYVNGNPGTHTATTVTVSITPGVTYQWWVHAYNDTAGWSTYTKQSFSCPAPGSAVDVFLIAGQSNAVGWDGSASGSPRVSAGKVLQYHAGALSDGNDPVGNANGGSAWPAFGNAYYSMTGHTVVLVPAAVPGTGQVAASDTGAGNWSASGTLFADSVSKLDTALSALRSAGHVPTFGGVLWDQGENDAVAIHAGTITSADYTGGLTSMIARYRAHYGASMPLFIFQTGTSPSLPDSGFAAVRAAQADVATGDPYACIVFTGASSFASRGMMVDAYHYTQAGYNEMGSTGAAGLVASGLAP